METDTPTKPLQVSTEEAAAAAPHDAMDVLAAAASKSPTATLATKPTFPTPAVVPAVAPAVVDTDTTTTKGDADAADDVKSPHVPDEVAPTATTPQPESPAVVAAQVDSTAPSSPTTSVPAVMTGNLDKAVAPASTTTTAAPAAAAPAVAVTTGNSDESVAPAPTTTTATPVAAAPTAEAASEEEEEEEEETTITTTDPAPAITTADTEAKDADGDAVMEPAETAADARDEAVEAKATTDEDSHAENPTAGDHATSSTTEPTSTPSTATTTTTTPSSQPQTTTTSDAGLTEAAGASSSASAAAVAATPARVAVESPLHDQPETTTTTPSVQAASPEAPAAPAPLRPSLRGKLQLNAKGVAEWLGQWGMDDDAFKPGGFVSQFSYKFMRAAQAARGVAVPLVPLNLPLQLKDGYFSGYFMMGSTVPGGPVVRVDERNILLRFSAHDDETETSKFKVNGSGKNKFGTFVLEGELDANTLALNVYREYRVRQKKKTPAARRAPPSTLLKSAASGAGAFATPGPDSNVATNGGALVPPPTAGLIPRGLQFGADDALLYSSSRARPERMRRMPSHLNLDSSNPLAKISTLLSEMVAEDKERYFCVPVDPIMLGIPDYHTIVTEPMDLGTVMKNIAEKVYHDEDEVKHHIRLTFQNAIKFNPAHHPIHKMAAQYLQLFDSKWDKVLMDRVREAERLASRRKGSKAAAATARKRKGGGDGETGSVAGSVSSRKTAKKKQSKTGRKDKKRRRKSADSSDEDNSSDDESESEESESEADSSESESSDDDSSSDEDDSDDEGGRKRKKSTKKKKKKRSGKDDKIRALQRQLDRLKKADSSKKKKKKKTKKPKSTKKPKKATKTPARKPATSTAGRSVTTKKSNKSTPKRPMSYQEKRTLGNDIRKCTSDQVNEVIAIIRQNGGQLGGSGDEVELDIDALPTNIHWLLHAYVRKCLLHSDPHPGVSHGDDEDSY